MESVIAKVRSVKQGSFNLKKIVYGIFILLILFHTVSLITIGSLKEGMHIDEYYSYILSNSYDSARISYDEQSWNRWQTGEYFEKFLVVDTGEGFSYDTVYYNNSLDAHPPLFYFLLHTICSLFPEQFSMWFGLGLNIFLIIITQVVLYLFTKEVTGSSLWGCVSIALYGATQAFFDTVLFIRMYALLGLFAVLLVWRHYRLVKYSEKLRFIVECAGVTFLGLFTQYYFAFLAFFLAVATCIYFIYKKEWKTVILYTGLMLVSVVLVFLVYPAGITQITGSDTNNVGNAVMKNILDFSKWFESFDSMLEQAFDIIREGFRTSLGSISCIGIITAFILGREQSDLCGQSTVRERLNNGISILVLFGVLIITVGVISHISAQYVYVRYIYYVIPLFLFVVSLLVFSASKFFRLNRAVLAVGIVACCIVSTIGLVKNNACSYLYQERTIKDNKIMEIYEDKPLVLINNGSTYQPTALMHFITNADQVYLANYRDFNNGDECLSQVDCSNGIVFIVLTDKKWSSGYSGKTVMTDIVKNNECFENYKKIGSCSFSTAYLAY